MMARQLLPAVALAFLWSGLSRVPALGQGITEFSIPTHPAGPIGIAAGPDGNLWFAENTNAIDRAGQIGRITLAGVVTESRVSTSGTNL